MNIIITGASRGIGFELAKYLASKGPHHILVISRNLDSLEILRKTSIDAGFPGQIVPLSLDLNMLEHDHARLIEAIETHCPDLDLLINNAGMLINKSFTEVSQTEAMAVLKVNFLAPANLIRLCLPYMGKRKRSHVINISSMGGVQGSVKFPGLAYYSAAKAAIAVLTECLAEEYNANNISFNCLALGAVQTEMLEEAFPGYRAKVSAVEMAKFIGDFCLNGISLFNGKIIPVALDVP